MPNTQMPWTRLEEFFRRLRYLLHRGRFDRELANEMEFHREMTEREGGERFGSVLRLREEAREAWGWNWIDSSIRDLRYSARQLRRSPGFTIAAVLMLALGIGVNIAAFGFFDLLVLRPMNVRAPATLLRFHRRAVENYAFALPYPEMAFFREHSKTLSAVLALNNSKLVIEGEEKPLNVGFVTTNFFSELGAAAQIGRTFNPARQGETEVVLSHGFWQRHFGADPAVLGKSIRLNDKPATVIGVIPNEFSGLSLDKTDLWAPINQQPYFVANSRLLTDFSVDSPGVLMWGRLEPGATPKMAEQELRSLAAQLRKQDPRDIWEKENLPSEPGGYAKSLTVGYRRGSGTEQDGNLYSAFAMVAALSLLILIVACGNLGSLLLARGVARQREIAIRVAIGAGSGRLMRQLFTESVVLALLGSAAGVLLGYFVLQTLMIATGLPAWLNAMPDWRVIVFAAGMSFVSAMLFGLAPAWQAARQRHRSTIMRQFLIGAQVAGSCVLLIVAGLLVRALDHATSAQPGFEYRQVISIDPGLAKHGYSPAKARAYLDRLQRRLWTLPGVESISLVLTPPLGNGSIGAGIDIDGRQVTIEINHVDPEFFQTMEIPLLRGRNLTRGDTRAIVISESLARGAWPGQNPLGKKFTMGSDYTVVGIAGSARSIKLEDSDSVEVYLPIEITDLPSLSVLVKTSASPEGIVRPAAAIAKSIDPRIFPEVEMMKVAFRRKLQGAEYSALSVGLLGVVALLLACLGIVGLMAFAVSQRTKEIGIRMALGAKPGHVLSTVLRQLTIPLAAGLVVGVGAAAALSQILRQIPLWHQPSGSSCLCSRRRRLRRDGRDCRVASGETRAAHRSNLCASSRLGILLRSFAPRCCSNFARLPLAFTIGTRYCCQ